MVGGRHRGRNFARVGAALSVAIFLGFGTLESDAAIVHFVLPEPIFIDVDTFSNPLPFDLDGDGVDDLGLRNGGSQIDSTPFVRTRFVARFEGSALNAGITAGGFIGASLDDPLAWADDRQVFSACASNICAGEFFGGRDYLGIEFEISGQTHYAWMQIESVNFTPSVTVIDWAYETEPGVGILAGRIPEPSVGILVLGVLGLLGLRRYRSP